jgi:ATP-binding cassette, subfamily C (CFTR/MRP), member 1
LSHQGALLCNAQIDSFSKVFYAVYTILHLTLLSLWTGRKIPKTRLTIACLVLTTLVYIIFLVVSYLEHLRSVRPSTFLCVYLGTSLLLDLARVRTLFLLPGSQVVARVFLAGFFCKSILLFLEMKEKRHLVGKEWQDASPEATSSIVNRTFFIWLNNTFFKGFRSDLTVDALTPLDGELLSASNSVALKDRWDKSTSDAFCFTTTLL